MAASPTTRYSKSSKSTASQPSHGADRDRRTALAGGREFLPRLGDEARYRRDRLGLKLVGDPQGAGRYPGSHRSSRTRSCRVGREFVVVLSTNSYPINGLGK